MTLLGGLLFCLSSCDKLGDDESDSGGSGGDRPKPPSINDLVITDTLSMEIERDSIIIHNL